jgi:hypothetical protein
MGMGMCGKGGGASSSTGGGFNTQSNSMFRNFNMNTGTPFGQANSMMNPYAQMYYMQMPFGPANATQYPYAQSNSLQNPFNPANGNQYPSTSDNSSLNSPTGQLTPAQMQFLLQQLQAQSNASAMQSGIDTNQLSNNQRIQQRRAASQATNVQLLRR